MKLDSQYIVVIGFPHNSVGTLDLEMKRSMDGLLKMYPTHAKQKRLALLYVVGETKKKMAPKIYGQNLFLENKLALDKILKVYLEYKLPDNISQQQVSVIFLIHATGGHPKLFSAQISTAYINKDNMENGHILVKVLMQLNLTTALEKIQLVMCGGAMANVEKGNLLSGLCKAIETNDLRCRPKVIGWDCEVTHRDDGSLKVGNDIDESIDPSHRHTMTNDIPQWVPKIYRPTAQETYQKIYSVDNPFELVYFDSPTGYVSELTLNWSSRPAAKTNTRCILL